jgi:hypothetical protein
LILKVKPEHKYCYEYKLRRVMKPIKRVCLWKDSMCRRHNTHQGLLLYFLKFKRTQ